MRFVGGAVAVAALLLLPFSPPARAEASSDVEGTHFHLSYEAPAACPDRGKFLAAIRARTKRPQLAAEGESAIAFAVAIEPKAATTVGRLDVREPGGAPQRRRVSGKTCGDVAEALALVVALILDPDARMGPEPEPPAQPDSGDASPPEVDAGKPGLLIAPPSERPHPPKAPDPTRSPIVLSAGAEVGARGGIGPGVAPAGGGFVDLELHPRGRSSGFFTPSVRLALDLAAISSDLVVGTQDYWWLGGTLRLCPLRAVLTPGLRLAPCGALELGALHASTHRVPNPTSSTTAWLAPVVGASLDWALSSSLSLELQGGAVFPLLRRRFFLAAPDTTIFEVPVVSGAFSVAMRLRFW